MDLALETIPNGDMTDKLEEDNNQSDASSEDLEDDIELPYSPIMPMNKNLEDLDEKTDTAETIDALKSKVKSNGVHEEEEVAVVENGLHLELDSDDSLLADDFRREDEALNSNTVTPVVETATDLEQEDDSSVGIIEKEELRFEIDSDDSLIDTIKENGVPNEKTEVLSTVTTDTIKENGVTSKYNEETITPIYSYVSIKSQKNVETSPLNTSGEGSPSLNTSRYGRARKQKTIGDFYPTDLLLFNGKSFMRSPSKSPRKTPVKSPKVPKPPKEVKTPKRSSGSPKRKSPKKPRTPKVTPFLMNGFTEDSASCSSSVVTPNKKVYVKKDMIQNKNRDDEETGSLLTNMFTPVKIEPKSPERELQPTPVIKVAEPPKPKFQTSLNSFFNSSNNKQEPLKPISPELIKKEVEDIPLPKSNVISEQESLCKYKVGDLVWARVGTYPFWPGLITRDYPTFSFVKSKVIGRSVVPSDMIHLTFFADSGRHSWVNLTAILPFTGLDDFNKLRVDITPETKKKDPKHYKAFNIPSNQKCRWLSAVSEAEMLLHRPPDTREDFFTNMFLASPVILKSKRKVKVEKDLVSNTSQSDSLFDSLFNESIIKNESSDENTTQLTHMDRWLMKAKEKSVFKIDDEKDFKDKSKTKSPSKNKRKRTKTSDDSTQALKKMKRELDCTDLELTDLSMNNSQIIDDIKTDECETPKRVLRRREAQIQSPQIKIEKSSSDIQVTQDSEQSTSKPVSKTSKASYAKYNNPDFQDFVDLQKDYVQDQYPDLDDGEIMEFLYKTWQYDEALKISDVREMDDFCQIKGMVEDSPVGNLEDEVKPKKSRQSKTTIATASDVTPLNKDLRKKTIKSYFCDNSDSDDEKFTKPIDSVASTISPISKISPIKVANIKEEQLLEPKVEIQPVGEESKEEVDKYMLALSLPKPNIFKGVAKSKLCDICEAPYNLVKCQGNCGGRYHTQCMKKRPEPIEGSKSKKRARKSRGRRRKLSGDDIELSEDKSVIEHDSFIVVDESEFEDMASLKMQEMLENSVQECDNLSICSDEDICNKEPDQLKCYNCITYDIPLCFVCKFPLSPKVQNEERQRCSVMHCCKYYHLECLKMWPQTKYNATTSSRNSRKVGSNMETLSCPRHICHTCVCDDPQGSKSRFSGERLTRCMRCPATYHAFTHCVPAGSEILTASSIICPRHITYKMGKVPYHVNTAWCFICAKGGTLVCCETCPTSFHAECLKIPLPEDGYICEDCETGRLPLYGEIVWVKFSHYRWWPALVLHPSEIPLNIALKPHESGQFVVRFFGEYDHYWVSGGRVFPYQEGDTGRVSGRKNTLDHSFLLAVKQAEEAYKIIKTLKAVKPEKEFLVGSLLPPQYVKLKVNRAVGGAVTFSKFNADEAEICKCECDPNTENPCAPDSNCLNRMLLIECSPDVCAAGSRCCNQYFEKRIYPELAPSRTSERGWGLKTLVDISKGDFIIEYVGEIIDETEFQKRMRRKEEMRDENYYFLTLDKDRMIDAGPKGNVARFMNHSCEPNCETQKWKVNGDIRVGLFASKDIAANDELTFNYNLSCAGDVKKSCLCGAPRCAGYIGAKLKPVVDEAKIQKKLEKLNKKTKRKYRRRTINLIPVKTESIDDPSKSRRSLQNLGSDANISELNLTLTDSAKSPSKTKSVERVKRKYVRKKKPIIPIALIDNYCKKVSAQDDSIDDDLLLINGTKYPSPPKMKTSRDVKKEIIDDFCDQRGVQLITNGEVEF